ncbi:MAG: hypothetical protein ACF8R7_01160 [Phycisphaerales bacterium JB039]
MNGPSEQTLAERFNDEEGMLQALRHAALFARLRREMWQKFRAATGEDGSAPANAAPGLRDAGEAQ